MPSLNYYESAVAVLAGFLILCVVWLAILTRSLRRLKKTRQKLISALEAGVDIEQLLAGAMAGIDELSVSTKELASRVKRDRAVLAQAIRHVGIVRYDAFNEAGGHLSFSAALLNEKGDGMVITSINGRNDSRVYAKPIAGRRSEFNLSAEEEKAIDEAYQGVKT